MLNYALEYMLLHVLTNAKFHISLYKFVKGKGRQRLLLISDQFSPFEWKAILKN